jgi:4-hydroxy-3-polyprenylbenzoate decarboxylase
MAYRNLQQTVDDLDKHGKLLRIKSELDPDLEIAAVHRRIFDAQGKAILFEKVKGSPFRALSNLYGTFDRTSWLFRDTLEKVQRMVELKIDPTSFLKAPLKYASAPMTAYTSLPKKYRGKAPILKGRTTISQLPLIKSWPMDGGAFVTMPQVLSLPPGSKNPMDTNVGMYRVQLDGNEYKTDKEIGLHYQLHRGIGVHHQQYLNSDEPFRVSVIVGGPPSYAFTAIMPLPEGLSELTFAGMLAGKSYRYTWDNGHFLPAEADFVITGTVRKDKLMPEGPFGDHLGYYSLEHDFPVMEVDNVYHRPDAIWHFSVVGRPPMEDSSFGYLISKIVKDLAPIEFPGVKAVNAVDAAGVHPLLLAVGSERYMPFRADEMDNTRPPEELLTQANRLLGSGQTSLAKFLIIADGGRENKLDCHDEAAFIQHALERIDWRRDLHFYTNWTIDTLDYSGEGWNSGSKVVFAARGDKRRQLGTSVPTDFNFGGLSPKHVTVPLPGVLALEVTPFIGEQSRTRMQAALGGLNPDMVDKFPLILLVDDASFVAKTLNNFLWVAFTRTSPSSDIYGVGSFQKNKHWGCTGPLVMDARVKPHHAPGLVEDPAVSAKVDKLFSKGGELYGVLPKGHFVNIIENKPTPPSDPDALLEA